jgi:solute carrier family 25 phosphate transporter 3
VQGAGKYGFYEYFKHFYSELAGEETAKKYKTTLYLTASASAEFIADIGLCPFEAVKVRMQTTMPPAFSGTFQGIGAITSKEGVGG